MKKNILCLWIGGALVGSLFLASCASLNHNGIYADVISFSDNAQTSYRQQSDLPFALYGDKSCAGKTDKQLMKERNANMMTQEWNANMTPKYERNWGEVDKITDYINNFRIGNNTAGYYALDLGLDRIKYVRKNILKRDKQTKYYIIYFTDGLDNTSLQVARNNKQTSAKTIEEYIASINRKKQKVMGNNIDQCFQIFPMILLGSDLQAMRDENHVSPKDFEEWLCSDEQFENFRGASKGWDKPKPIMAQNIQELQDKFKDQFFTAAFNFYIPKGYLNSTIRMKVPNKKGEVGYIEGKYVKEGSKYVLRNVKLHGEEHSDIKVEATLNDKPTSYIPELVATNIKDKKATKSLFTISGLHIGYNSQIDNDKDKVVQEYSLTNSTSSSAKTMWLINSEYDTGEAMTTNNYFLFIADCSKSLRGDFKTMQNLLVDFIGDLLTKSAQNTKK